MGYSFILKHVKGELYVNYILHINKYLTLYYFYLFRETVPNINIKSKWVIR